MSSDPSFSSAGRTSSGRRGKYQLTADVLLKINEPMGSSSIFSGAVRSLEPCRTEPMQMVTHACRMRVNVTV